MKYDDLVELRDTRVAWDEMDTYVWVMGKHHLRQLMEMGAGRPVSEEEVEKAVSEGCYLLGRPIVIENVSKVGVRV